MFVILNVVSSGKRKIRRGRTVTGIREFFTGEGERFYIIDVLDSEKGVDWDDVSYFLGKHSNKVLLDNSIGIPEFAPVSRSNSARFKNILLFNTLELIFRELFLSGVRSRCIINDPVGEYADLLPKIAENAAQVTVVTKNAYRYYSSVKNIFSVFGAGVSITDKMPSYAEDCVVLDTSENETMGKFYFSADTGTTPQEVEGFSHLKSLCPSYIDQTDFLAAVCCLNRKKELENAVCSSFVYNGEIIGTSELTVMMKNSLTGSESLLRARFKG